MEDLTNKSGESRLSVPITTSEHTALDIIRTETVLSRLPVHNLAKKGRVDIQILKTTPAGQVELKWEVSYNDRYGQARQLAYRLDTIIINQKIDEAGRPLPKILRLGSLNEICAELGLATDAGKNAKDLKRAFLQNASAFITAKFNYLANDKTERRLEAGFTRYGVIFTGEKLPDGRKADAVYVVFNDPFWEVLNNAPVRPLDRTYMKELPPAAQRFYEIISRKIFAALKNNYPYAKITYSEYCTFSAQRRSFDWNFVRPQMYQVHKPHVDSGYILKPIRHETVTDPQGNLDWVFLYTPGPKAQMEFAVAHGRKPKVVLLPAADTTQMHSRRQSRVARSESSAPSEPVHSFDPQLVAEFTRRGITDKKAIDLLSNLKPGQDVIAQLELGEYMAKNSKIPIMNPPGFYVRLIESNTSIPDGFETSAKRKAREEREKRERQERAAEESRRELEWEHDDYCQNETKRYIRENPAAFDVIKEAKWRKNRAEHETFSEEMITMIANREAENEIRRQLPLPTFEEFVVQKQQGNLFSLKLVAVPPAADVPALAEGAAPTEPAVPEEAAAPQAELAMQPEAAVVPTIEPAPFTPEPGSRDDLVEPQAA